MIVRDRGSGLRSVGVDWPQDPSSTQLLHHRLADSIEEILSPKQQRRPLPSLLYKSFLYG